MSQTYTQRELDIFFHGMEHARRVAAETERGKDKAIEREIVTLRLCRHVKTSKAATAVSEVAGAAAFFIIFTMPFWASWVFHALTGNLMQF